MRKPKDISGNFRRDALSHLPAVTRFASHVSRDPAIAEELVQETYVRAFRAEATFKGSAQDLRSWLFRILHNEYRARFRQRGQRTLGDASLEHIPAPAEPRPSVDLAIDWEAMDQELVHAIHDLPDDLRTVFLLLAVEEKKYREIAAILEIPIGTVMSRVSRARQLLIENLSRARQHPHRSPTVATAPTSPAPPQPDRTQPNVGGPR